jgi:hypothetical protein
VEVFAFYRVRINYRRISLCHKLSRECRKMVKCMSITHSERNIWNGPIVATANSRETRKPVLEGNGCPPTERSCCVQEFARCDSFVIYFCGVSSRTMFTSHHFQRHYQNCGNASTPQLGTSHNTCWRGFGGNVLPGHLPCHIE